MAVQNRSSKFESWIFDSYRLSFDGLGLFRIFTAFFILLYGLPSSALYPFLGTLPSDFYAAPPGPMMLFDSFPSEQVFFFFHYLLIISLVLLLFGLGTKYASLAVGINLLIIKGFIYSLGKINHDILIVIVPLIMAFSGWGKAYSIDAFRRINKNSTPQNWTLTLLALIIGFMFFTAGLPKILGGWLDLQTQATQGHFFKQFFIRERQDLIAPLALHFPGFLWEILDYATVLFEVAFLAAIFHPKSTRIFICIAAFFHFSTMMIMNIPFLTNFIAYGAFLNWAWVNENIRNATKKCVNNKTAISWSPPVMTGAGMLFLFWLLQILKDLFILQSDLTFYAVGLVTIAAVIALIYLTKELFDSLFKKAH